MMHVFLRADGESLRRAALDVAEETGIWIGERFASSPIPAYRRFELTVGDATLEIPTPEIADLFERWLSSACCEHA
jgi:hypothetical protein